VPELPVTTASPNLTPPICLQLRDDIAYLHRRSMPYVPTWRLPPTAGDTHMTLRQEVSGFYGCVRCETSDEPVGTYRVRAWT